MVESRFRKQFPSDNALIGMIHLPPLPDYPNSPGIDAIVDSALNDLRLLESAGFHGVLVENENDRPHKVSATSDTIAAMTEVTSAVVAASKSAVVGCEILLHDPQASLDVARSVGAGFIRTDYFVDRMMRAEYGEFAIDPAGLIEYRKSIGADHVLILADIQVKYATMIEPRLLAESAYDACDKGADGIVVTGDLSGDAPSVAELREAVEGARASGRNVPVIVGSGFDAENAAELLAETDAAIVGTALMTDGSVDQGKAAALMSQVESIA